MANILKPSQKHNAAVYQERPSLRQYEVCKPLGRGAYGAVYLVRSKVDGREYALKQIEITKTHEGIPQSVLRELTIMRQLSKRNHPNIVGLKTVFHDEGKNRENIRVNMIVERCDWDLFIFLRDIPKNLPEHQCKFITRQLLQGLEFIHSCNMVHRDLKPQNILINRDQTVKIGDFGLSKNYSITSGFTTLVVTLWYRSPEVLLQAPYGSGADMWAAGCIIAEICNRVPFFPGATEVEQLKTIFNKLGVPEPYEWPEEAVVDRSAFSYVPKKMLWNKNQHMPFGAVQLMTKCFNYNLYRRVSARDALNDPWLALPKSRDSSSTNPNYNNKDCYLETTDGMEQLAKLDQMGLSDDPETPPNKSQ